MSLQSSRISAGALNQMVAIQASSLASDGAGGNLKTWSDAFPNVYAAVEPVNGGEAFRQGVLNATQFYRVTIRWREGVSALNRLVWNGLPLNIRTCADPDGRRRVLIMTAESGAGEP